MRNLTKTNSDHRHRLWARAIPCHVAMRDDIGQAFVELALALPIFIALLLGAAEYAFLAYAGIEVSNAARAGVAYGAQSAATASDLAGMQLAATNDGPNVAGLSAIASQFCSCSNAAATPVSCASAPTTCTGARVLNYVEVKTTAAVTPPIRLPGLPSTYTLSGQAIMRVE